MGDLSAPSDTAVTDEIPNKDSQQAVGTPQFQQQCAPTQHAFASQLAMAQTPGNGRPGTFNMAGMAGSLPPTGNYRPGSYPAGAQQQRFIPPTSSPPVMPQMVSQYGPQTTMSMASQAYYVTQQTQPQQYYGNPLSQNQQQARPMGGYYPAQMIMGQQQPNPMASGYYYPQGGAGYPPHHPAMQHSMVSNQFYPPNPLMGDPRTLSQSATADQTSFQYPTGPKGYDRCAWTSGHTSEFNGSLAAEVEGESRVARGPPRKPRQSGHAIWIGNLPPQTDLMSLVHHVCKEAPGLESLFLISKSNCAFANFKDEQTCIAAQQKLHDSKFQSVRLVSRLRKGTVEGPTGVTIATGLAAGSSGSQTPHESTSDVEGTEPTKTTEAAAPQKEAPRASDIESASQKDKFFILKSLTVEDLLLSVRTGIWATQSHNEESLNNAFKAADNVYLVFSANKSGEYFGYARMVSPMNEDPEAAIEFAPQTQAPSDVDLPKAISTEATEFAPKGRIIDDSARGTIFWEAKREDSDGADEDESDTSSNGDKGGDGGGDGGGEQQQGQQQDDGTNKAWGKPFKLEWLSTARLPFYRTRGLRNPWNSNREVKIARDGTELESSVGRRLIGLFNRVQSPAPGPIPPGMMMPGYPPMRQPYQP